MAVSILTYDVSDLCLGKPALRSLPPSATVGDALSALKSFGDSYLTVCSADDPSRFVIGKVSVVDVVCFLSRGNNLSDPSSALSSPISDLLSEAPPGSLLHINPNTSLLEALGLVVGGAQNLIIPIQSGCKSFKRKKQWQSTDKSNTSHTNESEFCWLTHEDIVRFLFSCISLFSPLITRSLSSLELIRSNFLTIGYHEPATSAIPAIALAHAQQTSVAVVSPDGKLIGEISPSTIAACDESVVPAIATLSAGDLMAFIDCGGPPADLVEVVKAKLRERDMAGTLELIEDAELDVLSSSSDEESATSPTGTLRHRPLGMLNRTSCYSSRMARRAAPIVCHPESSLVAVIVQALVHRVNYVWVIENDYSLAGIVTFRDVLKVFQAHLQASYD